jgi:chromosome segregation ATPase
MSPEHLMAAATGNPYVLEKVQIDDDVKNLEAAHKRHEAEQTRLKGSLKGAERSIKEAEDNAKAAERAGKLLEQHPDSWVEIGGNMYDKKADPAERADAIREAIKAAPKRGWEKHVLGKYRGFDIVSKPTHDTYGNATGGITVSLYDPETGEHVEYVGEVRGEGDSSLVSDPMRALGAGVTRLRHTISTAQEKHTRARSDHEQLKQQIGKPFAKSDEYLKKLRRQKELDRMLAGEQEMGEEAWNAKDDRSKRTIIERLVGAGHDTAMPNSLDWGSLSARLQKAIVTDHDDHTSAFAAEEMRRQR